MLEYTACVARLGNQFYMLDLCLVGWLFHMKDQLVTSKHECSC